ncbi:hypothetical protein [Campylobacter sp. 19-13652]|uniref:hypothetical protein n=1 Tax=Campylobacter sp. 19-13652 TaxID=2840180 RepID=UPI001C78C161|nr:hypothetical protein [Campylobacter sp. 19-13652]BCX79265.1 hypothetical protein LBC_07270 [Campylobacter sp. 19-13652]
MPRIAGKENDFFIFLQEILTKEQLQAVQWRFMGCSVYIPKPNHSRLVLEKYFLKSNKYQGNVSKKIIAQEIQSELEKLDIKLSEEQIKEIVKYGEKAKARNNKR